MSKPNRNKLTKRIPPTQLVVPASEVFDYLRKGHYARENFEYEDKINWWWLHKTQHNESEIFTWLERSEVTKEILFGARRTHAELNLEMLCSTWIVVDFIPYINET